MAEQQWEQEPPEGQVAALPLPNETPAESTDPAAASEPSGQEGTPTEPQVDGASPAQNLNQSVGTSPSDGAANPPKLEGAPSAETSSDQAMREENERLRHEVESLRAKAERQSHPGRWRRGVTGVLVVLCCLGILGSTLTVWTSATFLNTGSWLTIVGPIGQNPKVIQSVSTYASTEVVTLLDVKQRTAQALPPRVSFLAAPLTQEVQNFLQSHVADLMRTPQFHQLWIDINARVHAQLLAALRGQTNVLHISNGVVTLNLIPVVDQGLEYAQQHLPGMLSQKVKLPQPSQLEVPQQAQQKLSQALGVQVPSNLGQIKLFQSAQLATAQQLLGLLDVLTVLLPILTAGLIVATLLISPDVRRTLLQLGIGIAITFIIVKIATGYLDQTVVSATDNNPTAQSVVQQTLQTVLGGFDTITSWLLAGGLVLAIGAFLAGRPEWFRAAYARIKQGSLWVRDQFQQRRHHTPPDAVGAAA